MYSNFLLYVDKQKIDRLMSILWFQELVQQRPSLVGNCECTTRITSMKTILLFVIACMLSQHYIVHELTQAITVFFTSNDHV